MGVFAAFAVVGFAAISMSPVGAALAESIPEPEVELITSYSIASEDAQSIRVDDEATTGTLHREGYEVYVAPKPTPTPEPTTEGTTSSSSSTGWAPPAVTPDPGSAQAIAYDMVMSRGWGDGEFNCLVALWHKESGWRVNALNSSSGAYGIPQSLPGNKMASAGADWETNPATQISWGLGYISGRYGSPCGAWGHSQARGWY